MDILFIPQAALWKPYRHAISRDWNLRHPNLTRRLWNRYFLHPDLLQVDAKIDAGYSKIGIQMAKRRANGEGNIGFWEEKGLHYARITLPNGKRRVKYSKKQSVVKAWLDDQKTRIRTGTVITNEKITVAELMRRYLENYAQDTVRITTFIAYKWVVENHILPELGNIQIGKLQPEQLDQFYREKLRQGTSRLYTFKAYKLLRQAFNQGIRWGLCPTNPTLLTKPLKPEKSLPKVWEAEDVTRFLDALRGHRWEGVFNLACGTGMRRGEILGLPRSNLHLEEGYLEITQTLTWLTGRGFIMLPPKTKGSIRSITLPGFVKDVLRDTLERRAVLASSPNWREPEPPLSDLVFTTNIGTPITPPSLRDFFKDIIAANRLPNIRFHDLRHTTATLLLRKNVHPKIVAELLGHTDIQMTLNTYTHVMRSMGSIAADAMQDLVGHSEAR